jgi:prepilin-type N-terminal cleavage/methylation domain-containing protein/prepilin-type processing-associated H-X9-DG protein
MFPRSTQGGVRGFSLLELLVTVSIIAILLGLLLAAVQQVRAAANKVRCANNARQLALALHMHHDSEDHLPAGVVGSGPPGKRFVSWHTHLLPHVEQSALWQSASDSFAQNRLFYLPPTPPALSTVVPLYGCPVDGRVSQVQTYLTLRVGLTSYLGNAGLSASDRSGLLYLNSAVRLTHVTDGTSQTIMVGERPPSPDFQFGWWYAGVGQEETGSADTVLGAAEYNKTGRSVTIALCPTGPYRFTAGRLSSRCDAFHFWSLHPGGAHFAFADGSVRFLAYSADTVLPALATRAGGEVVEVP